MDPIAALRRIGWLYLPMLLGIAIAQFGSIIDRRLASGVGEQAIAWMRYATTLQQFPQGLVTTAVSMAALPALARQAGDLAPRNGQWLLVHELTERIAAGELLPSSQAIFQYLEDSGRGDLAASLQRTLLELGEEHDFEAELAGVLQRLEQKLRRSRWEEIAKTAKSVGELPPEARDLISGAGRS